MPISTGLLSTCFYNTELSCHSKHRYEIESIGVYKQVEIRSAADKRAAKILDSSTVHDESRYAVGMLWAEETTMLPENHYSSLNPLKSLEKRLAKDPNIRNQRTILSFRNTELSCHSKHRYEIESIGVYKQVEIRSAADKRAAKILDSSTVHDESRYAVGMLWAEETTMLPENHYSSLNPLKSLEKRLAKDPNIRNLSKRI